MVLPSRTEGRIKAGPLPIATPMNDIPRTRLRDREAANLEVSAAAGRPRHGDLSLPRDLRWFLR